MSVSTRPSAALDRAEDSPRRGLTCGTVALTGLGFLVLMLVAGGTGIFLYFYSQHNQALRDVEAEIDRIHAAGEPITTADMFARHRVPEGVPDATMLWIEAGKLAATIKDPSEPQLPFVGQGKPADLRADAANSTLPLAVQFLGTHQETIEAAQTAAAVGGQCRFPVEFAAGVNATLEPVQNTRALARVLHLRLHVAVARGDVEEALESLVLELALAAALEHEPMLVSQLVRMAVVSMAVDDAGLLANETPLSDDQLRELQNRLGTIPTRGPLKEGLLGERAMGFRAFHNMSVSASNPMGGIQPKFDESLQRPADCRFYLAMMAEVLAAAEEPVSEARVRAKQIDARLKAMLNSKNFLERQEMMMSMQLLPALSGAFDAGARSETNRDSVIAGIAFRRFQLKHGRPPDSLEALVPEFLTAVPRDPFQAAALPLRFVVTDDQFAIYSVGQNLTDDRALLSDPESQDDVGFAGRLPLPAQQPKSDSPADEQK